MSALEEKFAQASARARTRLESGESLAETLRVFREDDELGPLGSMIALRMITPIGLDTAKLLVVGACYGEDFSHLRLDDLAQLAALPHGALYCHLRDAVIDRGPWLLLVPGDNETVRFYTAREPDASRAGTSSGSFASWRDELRALAGDARWKEEIEIVRDEPDAILLRFRRVDARR